MYLFSAASNSTSSVLLIAPCSHTLSRARAFPIVVGSTGEFQYHLGDLAVAVVVPKLLVVLATAVSQPRLSSGLLSSSPF